MNEEAGFIAALLAEPDDRTTLLVYADWLDDRNDPRAEYLRVIATDKPSKRRLAKLQAAFDTHWTGAIETRHFQVGDRVRVIHGSPRGLEGELIEITPDRAGGKVRKTYSVGSYETELPLTTFERIAAPASE
jgi:uncharacterized protein (TIGR02996 family)